MIKRKGLLLAGGTGSRLRPVTLGLSKQLLPIYDKPMIYYSLTVLMLSDIREIAVISTPHDLEQYKTLLGDGSQWGLSFEYIAQESPDGIAQAYILADEFLRGEASALVLGDNVFFGHGLSGCLETASSKTDCATVFGYEVAEPTRYGVAGFDSNGNVTSITEKPKNPASNYAITGLYFLDGTATEKARSLKPSLRGELEITTLLDLYLHENKLSIELLGRGYAWLDTGTHESLIDAGNFVRTLQKRQGVLVGSPDEIAYKKGWISKAEFSSRTNLFETSEYGKALQRVSK